MIDDFRIETLPEHAQFAHGLLHLTPTVTIQGLIKFTVTKAKPFKSIKLLFTGSVSSALRIPPADHVLYSEEKLIFSRPIPLETNIVFTLGEKEVPFTLTLTQADLAGLPGSLSFISKASPRGDEARVTYTLTSQIETASSFFSPSKKLTTSEDVDLPLYNPTRLLTSQQTDTTAFISGITPQLEYRVTVSRSTISLHQPVTFHVHTVQALAEDVVIKSLQTRIRQDIVIHAEQRTKKVSSIIALGAGKFYPKPVETAAAGYVSWTGEAVAQVGERSATLKRKDTSKKTEAFSTGSGWEGMFEVKHFAELAVVLKDGKEVCFSIPMELEAVDPETKEWLLIHSPKILQEE
ncbi:hypothetical protein HDU79_005278 [Rhizoclosmatium sp. JEL0117]|nr:hypothetical protein HDU79_005278 [Rhizoclosmatium sp. JEL0117]